MHTPPPLTSLASSVEQTPLSISTSAFKNSSEHRESVDKILKLEMGTFYVGIPGFWDVYFGNIPDLSALTKSFMDDHMPKTNQAFSQETGWADWPEKTKETSVVTWLTNFIGTVLDYLKTLNRSQESPRILLNKPSEVLAGSVSKRKVDFGFACQKAQTIVSTRPHWSQVLVPGELKRNPSMDKAPTWLDLARYVREIFSTGMPRRFVLGFTLCGSLLRVWSFDRLGAIASEQINIQTDPLRFVSIMIAFLIMNDEQLGFDTSVKSDANTQYITISHGDNNERLTIEQVLLRTRSIVSRGTICWKAQSSVDGSPLIVKDSWQHPERPEEGEMLRKLAEKNIPYVARYYHHEDVFFNGKKDDVKNIRGGLNLEAATDHRPRQTKHIYKSRTSTQSPRRDLVSAPVGRKRAASQTEAVEASSKRSRLIPVEEVEDLANRVHRRVILKDCGRPIYEASSIPILLEAFHLCLEGHRGLFNAGFLHRDISINNLLINEHSEESLWKAFIIDLDLAIPISRSKKTGAKGKTGTRAFMAIGVLRGHTHTYMHDLESFFWVLFWLCIHYNGPQSISRQSAFEQWNVLDDYDLFHAKLGVIANEEVYLQDTEHFTEFYAPLAPITNELRKVVFPNGQLRRQGELDPALYDRMIAVIQKGREEFVSQRLE